MKTSQLSALCAVLTVSTLPFLALAAPPPTGRTLQSLLYNIPLFIERVLIPFLFGIAFLIFVINVIRFFVIEGSNEQGREKAKNLALYSVGAFVFLIIFWGLVNILVNTLGLGCATPPMNDYQGQTAKGAKTGC